MGMTDYNETPIRVVIPSNNYPTKHGQMVPRRPVGAILHHPVGTLPGVDATFRNPDLGYATNTCIGSTDGRGGGAWEIHEYVPPEFVAWGNGNTDLNNRGVSIEHENDLRISIVGKPRPEVHELSARYLAKLAVKYDWRINGVVQLVLRDFPNHDFYDRSVPGFGVEFNVTGHRSVALKDCPKDLDMQWIVNRGNQYIKSGLAGIGYEPIIEENDDMRWIKHPTMDIWFLFIGTTVQRITDVKQARNISDGLGRESDKNVSRDGIVELKVRDDAAQKILSGAVVDEIELRAQAEAEVPADAAS